MITIVAKSIIEVGKKEEFLALAMKLVKESRKEEGCIEYSLYQDIRNENVVSVIEKWKDQEAIDIHNNSKHFTTIVPQLGKLREGSEVTLYKEI